MAKRRKPTPEAELNDAIERMRKKPEAIKAAKDTPAWREYLDNLGIHENAINSDNGSKFWERVRENVGVQQDDKGQYRDARGRFARNPNARPPEPRRFVTDRAIAEARAYRDTDKLGRAHIRSNETGRFVRVS